MNKFYVVTFTAERGSYHVKSVHTDEAEAVAALLGTSLRTRGAVLRHGATGKRESLFDVRARTQAAA